MVIYFSKTKDEVYRVLNKHIKEIFKNIIKKHHEQKRLPQGLNLPKIRIYERI